MNRAQTAILATIAVLAGAFVLLRPSNAPPAASPDAGAPALRAVTDGGSLDAAADAEVQAAPPLDVKELALGDASDNRRSVRVQHPDPAVRQRLEDWLAPRETEAVATKASLECVADTATKPLVSLRCVSVAASGKVPAPTPVYTTLTLRIAGSEIKELALADVLRPGVGEKEVVEACQKAADPPLPCGWPPSAFSIVGGESLFICKDHNCVDLDDETKLVRPELTAR